MAERLIEKLDRLGAEAGIKQMTPEVYRFALDVRKDLVSEWPERPVDKTYEAIIAGAKADGSWDKKYPEEDDDIQDYKRPWIWLSDADIRETIDSICQYTGDYDEWLCKKIERKIRSINNG